MYRGAAGTGHWRDVSPKYGCDQKLSIVATRMPWQYAANGCILEKAKVKPAARNVVRRCWWNGRLRRSDASHADCLLADAN